MKILQILLISILLIGCSKNDDTEETQETIIGRWYLESTTIVNKEGAEQTVPNDTCDIENSFREFFPSLNYAETAYAVMPDTGECEFGFTQNGTYIFESENTLKITVDGTTTITIDEVTYIGNDTMRWKIFEDNSYYIGNFKRR